MSKPSGTYKTVDLPDYKELALDELILFAQDLISMVINMDLKLIGICGL